VTYNGKVYAIPRDFVDGVHPGGADAILAQEDGNMTAAFDMVGHSEDAIQMLEEWQVPEPLPEAVTAVAEKDDVAAKPPAPTCNKGGCASWLPWVLGGAAAVGVYLLLRRYLSAPVASQLDCNASSVVAPAATSVLETAGSHSAAVGTQHHAEAANHKLTAHKPLPPKTKAATEHH
jgi:hypothetical protein